MNIFLAGLIQINPNIPGTNMVNASSGIGAYVANFYQFALLIAGVLALGAIVYGGVKYATSAGNPSSQSDGKEWILSAIYGLLLLAGAYLILYTINPNLVNLSSLPTLSPVALSQPAPISTSTPPGPGLNCKNGPCIPFIGVSCKNGCSADQLMVPVVTCIQRNFSQGIIVTEAMPTSSPHLSTCHNNGCCVDMTVANVSACTQVSSLINAAQSCGGRVLNEYFLPVNGQSCGGQNTEYSTGNHLHVVGC